MNETTMDGRLLPPPEWGDELHTIGEEGEYIVSQGHRDAGDMVRACNALVGEPDDSPDAFNSEWVTHKYAQFLDDLEHDWVIQWAGEDGQPVKAGDPQAFAVTVMDDLR
jgi:hypothetical protein